MRKMNLRPFRRRVSQLQAVVLRRFLMAVELSLRRGMVIKVQAGVFAPTTAEGGTMRCGAKRVAATLRKALIEYPGLANTASGTMLAMSTQ